MIDGCPRPDYGPGGVERVCAVCHAEFIGHTDDGEWCPWCDKREARHRKAQRALLLEPPWLRTSIGDPRYDALDEDTKAVWDRTRGQERGHDSMVAWAQRLRRAIETDLITKQEADHAIRRAAKWDKNTPTNS